MDGFEQKTPNTKEGSITVELACGLTGLDSAAVTVHRNYTIFYYFV